MSTHSKPEVHLLLKGYRNISLLAAHLVQQLQILCLQECGDLAHPCHHNSGNSSHDLVLSLVQVVLVVASFQDTQACILACIMEQVATLAISNTQACQQGECPLRGCSILVCRVGTQVLECQGCHLACQKL